MRTKRPSAHRCLLAQPTRKTNVLQLKPTAAPVLRARAFESVRENNATNQFRSRNGSGSWAVGVRLEGNLNPQ
jgi:hypothetical protein